MQFKNFAPGITPKKSDSFYAWGAFIAFYGWFNIISYNFDTSPLKYLSLSIGASADLVFTLNFIFFATGALLAMLFLDDQFPKEFFVTLQYIWAGLSFAILAGRQPPVLYALIITQGLCAGIIFSKIVYALIFFTPNGDWVRNIVITYAFIQAIIYFYLVFPVKHFPLPVYLCGTMVQIFCCYFYYHFNGSVLAVRRGIPPAEIKIRSLLLPILAFFIFILGITIVRNYVIPSFRSNPWVDYYQIIPNAITLFALYRWGGKLQRVQFLQVAIFLMGLTFVSMQLFKGSITGRFVTETLMQPAYLFWDVYMISFIADLIYKYGKKYIHARTIFLFIILIVAIAEVSVSHLLSKITVVYPQTYVAFYVLILILLFLIPSVKTFLEREFANLKDQDFSPISEKYQIHTAPTKITEAGISASNQSVTSYASARAASTGNPGFEKLFPKISKALPAGVVLTQREQEVLEQLSEKQDNDVIGNILGISKNTVKIYLKNLYTKFNVKNRAELYALMGVKESSPELTKREKEVWELLNQGKRAGQIARELHISSSTARRHIWNIRQKTSLETQKD